MSQSLVVYDSVASSNMPQRAKSAVLNFLDRYTGGAVGTPSFIQRFPKGRTAALLRELNAKPQQSMTRQQGEALLFGGLLAATKNTVGLDVGKAKNVPVDGLTAVVSLGLGALLARRGSGLATECNNLAASALTLLSFRKLDALMAGKLPSVKAAISGDDDEDPVVACGHEL